MRPDNNPIFLDMEDDALDLDIESNDDLLDLDISNPTSGSGTNDYNKLINKPKINDTVVEGNKPIEEYGVRTMTNMEIKAIFDRVFNKGGN